MRHEITFTVVGIPAPQGSKRHVGNGVMVESSKKVAPWRKAVADAVFTRFIETGDDTSFTEPVEIWSTFFIPRPPSVKRIWPHIPPDLDKLERGLFDAITLTHLWADDSLVVRSHAVKYYADVHAAGAAVTIRRVEDLPPTNSLI